MQTSGKTPIFYGGNYPSLVPGVLMFMALSTSDPVIGYILNVSGTLLLAALVWFARLAFKKLVAVFEKVEHLDECMDRTQETINRHLEQADARDVKIAALERELSNERQQRTNIEAYIRGLNNMPIDAPLTAIPIPVAESG